MNWKNFACHSADMAFHQFPKLYVSLCVRIRIGFNWQERVGSTEFMDRRDADATERMKGAKNYKK